MLPRFGGGLAIAQDADKDGKQLVIVSARDQGKGWVHAYQINILDEDQVTPNPNTSKPKDLDTFAESQCGCSASLGVSWTAILVTPLLFFRRRS